MPVLLTINDMIADYIANLTEPEFILLRRSSRPSLYTIHVTPLFAHLKAIKDHYQLNGLHPLLKEWNRWAESYHPTPPPKSVLSPNRIAITVLNAGWEHVNEFWIKLEEPL